MLANSRNVHTAVFCCEASSIVLSMRCWKSVSLLGTALWKSIMVGIIIIVCIFYLQQNAVEMTCGQRRDYLRTIQQNFELTYLAIP